MKLTGGITAVALMALLALPAGASAGTAGDTESLGKSKGFKYLRATYENVVTQTAQPVLCPAGQDIFGGGGTIGGNPADVLLNETYPLAESGDIGWVVEGTSFDQARDMTGYAICGPSVVTYVSQQTPLGDGASITSEQSCPIGFDPVSGGMSATGPGLSVVGTEPVLDTSPRRWGTSAENTGVNDTLVTAYAVCTGNYKLAYRAEETKLPAAKAASLVVKCKDSEAVVGGGFSSDDGGLSSEDSHVVTSRPWDSKDKGKTPDDGWQAKTSNDSIEKQKLVVTAVCFKRELNR